LRTLGLSDPPASQFAIARSEKWLNREKTLRDRPSSLRRQVTSFSAAGTDFFRGGVVTAFFGFGDVIVRAELAARDFLTAGMGESPLKNYRHSPASGQERLHAHLHATRTTLEV
jgi:hypothetical protein